MSAALIAAAFYYVMDDSVYVAADVEGRYGIPAIGILAEGNGKWTERFDAELVANCRYLGRNMEKLALVGVDAKEDAEKAGKRMSLLLEQRKGPEKMEIRNEGMPEEDTEVYARLREADGVLVAVRFGGKNGKAMERLLGNLRKQDCKILGAVIVDAKADFLRMYYKR